MTTREERKSKGICDRIEGGCAKRVGSNKNVFGTNAAVQSFNIQHRICKRISEHLSSQVCVRPSKERA
jgi:hypothetical protein